MKGTPRTAYNRLVVGKRVKELRIETHRVGGVTMHYPEIEFEDGSRLEFIGEEHPEGGDYGVFIRYVPANG